MTPDKRPTGVRIPMSRGHSNRAAPSGTAVISMTLLALLPCLAAQCPYTPADGPLPTYIYNNQTDKTNNGASYIGSSACSACHANYAALQSDHPHAHALKMVEGAAPSFPDLNPDAGVPDPPAGFAWADIAYLIGGNTKGALFVGPDGNLITTGRDGVDSQWNLNRPANGTTAGFVAFNAASPDPLPFAFDRFRKLTTGPIERSADHQFSQDNRMGIEGTWSEPGIQCEACHGPGSKHIPNPKRRDIFVDPTGAQSCNQCHAAGFDPDATAIAAAEGFILPNQQATELKASGGHSTFKCTICHDPHIPSSFDGGGIRNTCTVCHTDANMALHRGKVFTRGDYTETLSCESCHMTFATRGYSSASTAVVGDDAHMGDTRTHIFRINPKMAASDQFFENGGSTVKLDAFSRAEVTLDFVCLRCHNDNGAFKLSVQSAGDIAPNIHLDLGNQ